MAEENLCPTCGAPLKAGQECPFCAEARRLVAQLAEQEDVRLCARCGALLQPVEEEICERCLLSLRARALQVRREDRVARWIRDRFVEPPAEQMALPCPSCGQPMPPLAAFCPYCGHRVGQARLAAQRAPTMPPQEPSVAQAAPGEALPAPAPIDAAASGLAAASIEPAEGQAGITAERGGSGEGTASPSWLERARAFCQDQFQPFVEEWRSRPQQPLGERVRKSWQQLFRPRPSGQGTPGWLWAMLFLVLAGLVGMIIFWTYLLNSGVRFR